MTQDELVDSCRSICVTKLLIYLPYEFVRFGRRKFILFFIHKFQISKNQDWIVPDYQFTRVRRTHIIDRVLFFIYKHWVDNTAGGLTVFEGFSCSVFSALEGNMCNLPTYSGNIGLRWIWHNFLCHFSNIASTNVSTCLHFLFTCLDRSLINNWKSGNAYRANETC